jgi:malonyl-CoA decarboxylase
MDTCATVSSGLLPESRGAGALARGAAGHYTRIDIPIRRHPEIVPMFESVQKQAAALARDGLAVRRLVASCRSVLSSRGEAAGVSLATATLDLYRALDRKEQQRFFAALLAEFSPDAKQVLAAAQAYAAEASAANLGRLSAVAEPPRQELLRRLNRAPGGTAAILRMRERILELKRDYRELEAVDADFRHLLASWFNPGFLQIVRVDWRTPAYLLEQIIVHEAVHEIHVWNDLRRRLDTDGRCYAFFHPALPDEPLIFVEVALMDRIADAVPPLLDAQSASKDASRANTAVFYSISNCQPGLRGVPLGNFLIKRVVDVLSQELPRLKVFCTLSPIPGFAAWLASQLASREAPDNEPLATALKAVSRELGGNLASVAADAAGAPARLASLKEPLTRLCATYLLLKGDGSEPAQDPVARFHLNNGARMERINWLADPSRKGLRDSLGMMVNYLYLPSAIQANHQKFVRGEIVASRRVRSLALGE